MTKNQIIKHYKDFFDLHAIPLDEDDHLHIDWAVDLVSTISNKVQDHKKNNKDLCECGRNKNCGDRSGFCLKNNVSYR